MMADLRYLLAIYVHAHQTGNSVPPHIDAEARAALAEPMPEVVGVTDENWDALVDRLWGKYETIGYQGERFMYEGEFSTALDLVRQEIARWGNPAPAPPADGEVADDALALFVESQRPMDPEVAAILTPDVLWDLYEGTPLPADGSRRTQEIRADILTIATELENQ